MERPTQVATILDEQTYEEFAQTAAANDRSLAAELRVAVKRYLAEEKAA